MKKKVSHHLYDVLVKADISDLLALYFTIKEILLSRGVDIDEFLK